VHQIYSKSGKKWLITSMSISFQMAAAAILEIGYQSSAFTSFGHGTFFLVWVPNVIIIG
jgi:hypothetical protein